MHQAHQDSLVPSPAIQDNQDTLGSLERSLGHPEQAANLDIAVFLGPLEFLVHPGSLVRSPGSLVRLAQADGLER